MTRLEQVWSGQRWSGQLWLVVTVVLAAGYLYVGVASPEPSSRWTAIIGAALVLAALALKTLWTAALATPVALGMLLAGAVTPVVTQWWSVVVPITGLLILGCGVPAVRALPARR